MKSQKKTKVESLRDNIAHLTKEISKNTERIEHIDQEIHRLKLRKSELRIQLKHHYLSMLKNEEHIL